MPLPFIIGGALLAKVAIGVGVAAGAVGVAKGVQGAIDSSDAKEIQEKAERVLRIAKRSMESEKDATSQAIEDLGKIKVGILAKEMNDFVVLYQQIKSVQLSDSIGLEELRKLGFSNQKLKEMKDVSIGAINVLAGLGAGAGAGALLGWGAYGGVMALGAASTGTAISALSGVAATNATLAWLGGGALAAGGGGMALGTAVLGGLVAGPALLITGGLFASSAKEQLNNAKSNLAEAREISEELSVGEEQLRIMAQYASELKGLLEKTNSAFKLSINNMSSIIEKKTEWKLYSIEEKQQVAATVKQAILLKGIIDTPLLTEDGVLTKEIKRVITNVKQNKEFIGSRWYCDSL
ncbi:hypothetical protein [Anaerotignum sp.]|uniref:hypothetical protein n=1 Tax=Anaerotignum sp. TaxID=2039241 RepID=UPI0028AF9D54|nr:hypothetical protein [Anaerotignum sp.]